MQTFICFVNWTNEGVKSAKDAPQRTEAVRALAKKLGGQVVGAYITTGQFDVVGIFEMPDGDAMIKLVTALNAKGTVRTNTVRAFTPEEFGKLAAEGVSL